MSGRGSGAARSLHTALWVATVAFLAFAVTGGGRIVGSDEVTMLELARSMLHGRIDVPEGATLRGPDGRFYTKNAPGEAILALPLVAVAEVAARASGLPPERRTLVARFVVSFFNAAVAAALLAVFYMAARDLGVRTGPALAATLMLGFTTPLWVYAKSFMAEVLQGLGLLLALWGSARAPDGRRGPWLAYAGFLLAALVKPSMGPITVLCLGPLWWRNAARGARVTLALAGIAFALHGLYDFARFRDVFQTGYGAQATPSAYTTPLLVGLYGLLISSGKGVLWFAPALWLVPAGARAMTRAGGPARAVAFSAGSAAFLALGVYATFEHWAGDGSWGPRYLVPLMPLAFLAVAFALEHAGRARRALAWGLGIAGLIVQLGGVSIHFGAQMREAGDYPYSLPLSDPRFMSDSHWNPRFSPIAGHWRMLCRNAGEHLHGRFPQIGGAGGPGVRVGVGESGLSGGAGDADARVGVGAEDQERLLHGLDFWWLYTLYAGLPALPVGVALGALSALLVWAALRLRDAVRAEARAA